MSRRKQKFPVHLKNEQLEGGAHETEGKVEMMSEECPEEFNGAKDVRVPVNGQVVNVPISSSVTKKIMSIVPVTLPVEGVMSSTPPVSIARVGGISDNSVVVTLPSSSSSSSVSQGNLVGPVHRNLTTPLSVTLSTSSCNNIKSAKSRMSDSVSSPSFSNSAITLLTTVTSSANLKKLSYLQDSSKEREKASDDGNKAKNPVSVEFPYTCPVCNEPFRSKRSFNAHIIVHCQLVNGSSNGPKRSISSGGSPSPDKKRVRENVHNEQLESAQHGSKVPEEELSLPLDLSCRGSSVLKEYARPAASSTPENKESLSGSDTESRGEQSQKSLQEPPLQPSGHLNHSVLSDRGPLEDENENLVNEARERENSFFNTAQNEQYLTEDSTGLDPPPPLPLYGSGGSIRRIRVSSDDGPPMIYSVRLHAEQVLVSRILGINEETGDKMELYKCFLCSVAFPSISRLQAHLSQHKQRFVCCKCNFSCDSRVQFSHHVQREHLSTAVQSRRDKIDVRSDMSDDSNSAENTVTVAALLSALREKQQENRPVNLAPKETYEEEEEDHGSEDSCPVSPSSESQEAGELQEAGSGEDLFKMYTCRFCGKKFDRAFSCNRHERVHTGYKPCFCRVCGRGFSEPRNLRHHVIRFHSDGSLRHLIKRDRRKKVEDDSPTPSVSPVPLKYPESRFKDVLKETANKLITSSNIDMTGLSGQTNGLEITLTANISNHDESKKICEVKTPPLSSNDGSKDPSSTDVTSCATTYTTNLTKIIAASLDNSTRGSRRHPSFMDSFRNDELEPGEIRLDRRTKIIDDGESGRRLVITDDQSEEGLDHSPHFSNYAPRLNIVQEPIDRDKALVPITDDIGRTFFECPYCHKLFLSTSDMNRHLDFHEDLRPYNCEYCDYSARTNSQLKVHKMRHEGIKLYSCDVCNYNGVTQSDLNRHKKTQSHIARTQNVCSMCGLGFYTASQKQVHVVQCHPEVEGASSLIQMSLGPPVAPLMTGSEFSSLNNSGSSATTPPLPQAAATAQ
ncbi:zinc finger protein 236-like isoform X2 [Macrobrachium nipponense]|uniref:zinc finger protein 236-like isoform X2 n=1 Tax=Macrobrachium nipponense TaxID=159736 RepID=UPI0030C8006A